MHPRYLDPEIETLPRAQLEKLQAEKLAAQVARVIAKSPFYRAKYAAAGFSASPRIAAPEDVRKLPILSKSELREAQAAKPYFGDIATVPASDFIETLSTTGTTGRPFHCVWTKNDLAYTHAVMRRTVWTMGIRPGDIVQIGFAYGLFVAGVNVHLACQQLGCLVVPIGATNTERHLEYLTGLKSTALFATPSFAMYLAERLKEAGVAPESLGLRIGCFGGEPGTAVPATRAKLEAGLGLDARDYYGLAEICPGMSPECEAKDGIHFCEDHVIVEVLDPETKEPVADGEAGVLVLTDLSREAVPLLRYWTNDLVRLVRERCACGRTHARAPGGIVGRGDDRINLKGAKFYPTQVENAVRAFAELAPEFRIVLAHDAAKRADNCTVRVELAPGFAVAGEAYATLIARVAAKLRAETGSSLAVEIVPTGSLERAMTKSKRVIDNRKPFAR